MMAYTLPCRKDIPKWSAMVTRQDLFSAYPNSTKMFSWIQVWHQAKRKSNPEALRRGCRSTLSLLCCFNWLRYLQLSNIAILDFYWLTIEIKDHIEDKLQTARDVHVIIFSRLFTLAAYIPFPTQHIIETVLSNESDNCILYRCRLYWKSYVYLCHLLFAAKVMLNLSDIANTHQINITTLI